jgi:hypothetical protein
MTLRTTDPPTEQQAEATSLAQPEILSHVTIGFNSTVRALELMSKKGSRLQDQSVDKDDPSVAENSNIEDNDPRPAIFVCRSTLPPVLVDSIPPYAVAASQGRSPLSSFHLVPLAKPAENELTKAMYQPRVGVLGVWPATAESRALLTMVKEHMPPPKARSLNPSSVRYWPVNVKAREVESNPNKRKHRGEAKTGQAES